MRERRGGEDRCPRSATYCAAFIHTTLCTGVHGREKIVPCYRIHFPFQKVAYTLHCREPKLIAKLNQTYGGICSPDTNPAQADAPGQKRYELYVREAVDGAGYSVTIVQSGNPVEQRCDSLQSVFLLLGNLFFEKAVYPSRYMLLHAGCVKREKTALLLLGATGMGKSTLSIALSQEGYDLVNDDQTLIDCTDNRIIPVYKPVHLREGGVSVLKENGYSLSSAEKIELGDGMFRYSLSLPRPDLSKIRRMCFVFLKREGIAGPSAPARNPALKRLSQAELLAELLHSQAVYWKTGSEIVRNSVNLAKKNTGYTLFYSRLNEAVRQIDALWKGEDTDG